MREKNLDSTLSNDSLVKQKSGINKIAAYVLFSSLSVSVLLGNNSSQADETNKSGVLENVQTQEEEKNISLADKQMLESKELIDLLGSLFGNTNLELDKTKLNDLYDKFLKLKLPPNTKIFIKNFLLESYLKMLDNGYTINGYKELDQLIDIINKLSDEKISIRLGKSMPNNSEFKEELTIKGTNDNNRITIEKDAAFFSFLSTEDKVKINMNNKKLVGVFLSDIPNSLKESIDRIIDMNQNYLNIQKELRDSLQKIGRLEFQIEQLNQKIELIIKNNNEEISKIKRERDEKIKQLEIEHKTEIDNLEKKLLEKEKEIEKLNKEHRDNTKKLNEEHKENIKKLNGEHKINIRIVENNANSKIVRIEEAFKKDEEKLNSTINGLKEEAENIKQLNSSHVKTLEKQIEELTESNNNISKENTKLLNNITVLEENIKSLESEKTAYIKEIKTKQDEVTNLFEQRDQLVKQISTVDGAKEVLLEQTQDNLRRSELRNTGLSERISNLNAEIKALKDKVTSLEEEKSKLLELEDKAKELKTSLEKIKLMGDEIIKLEREKIALQDSNQLLVEENKKYVGFEVYLEKYNTLLEESKNKTEKIETLSKELKEKKTNITILEEKNKGLQQRLDNQIINNATLLGQIEEMSSTLNRLMQGSINLSNDEKTEELRKTYESNKKLGEQNQTLSEQLETANKEKDEAQRKLLEEQANFIEREAKLKDEFKQKLADEIVKKVLGR